MPADTGVNATSKHAAMAVRRLTIIRTAAFCCWSSAKHTRRTPLCRRMNGEPQDARRRERGARSKLVKSSYLVVGALRRRRF